MIYSLIIMIGLNHYINGVIKMRGFTSSIIILLLIITGCNKYERIVGNTCNGIKVEQGTEKKSACYILKERWSDKDIDKNIIMNISHIVEKKIRDIEQGVGVYAGISDDEKFILINEIKGELSIYKRDDWLAFIKLFKKGDKFYSYTSKKNIIGLGAGIIIVRNSKVIGSYETLTE